MNFRVFFTLFVLYLFLSLSATEPIVDLAVKINLTPKSSQGTDDGISRNLKKVITGNAIEDAFKSSEASVAKKQKLEGKLAETDRVVKTSDRRTDPSLIRMRASDPIVHSREARHMPFEQASYKLYKRYNLTSVEIERMLPHLPLSGKLGRKFRQACTEAIAPAQCDRNAKYRTADGQCNNLENPTWGSALSCQQRLLPANYVGNWGIRQSVHGGPLPRPRVLSLNLHNHLNRPSKYWTHMHMFFGQFLDHDLVLTPSSTTDDNEAIQCCPPEQESNSQCMPIIIGSNDPFYSRFNITCMNFVRSAVCPTCKLGMRKQMNQLTSFIDASHIYGTTENETASLRDNDETGRMRVQSSDYGDLLPSSPNPDDDQCSFPETNDICFMAGDSRVNQHPPLTSLHTVFVREHNRLATEMHKMNPHWNGEKIFQECRRIVGAYMQVITYKEYLSLTIGKHLMSYFKLWLGYTTNYDPHMNPALYEEFSTAGFRFGHSQVNSAIVNSQPNGTDDIQPLRDVFFQPFGLREGSVGPLMKGACNSPAQKFDQHLVPDVTNFLYRIRGDETGLDLASFNINRGRDHGMPTYVEVVRYCSRGELIIRNYRDLCKCGLMKEEQVKELKKNYRDVKDIDLWPGMLMETPIEYAIVGPTVACVIGVQLHNLKYGDRFYFEHQNEAGSFTPMQAEELRHVRLSYVLCMNTDQSELPRNVMTFSSRDNPMIPCQYVRGIDLSHWKE